MAGQDSQLAALLQRSDLCFDLRRHSVAVNVPPTTIGEMLLWGLPFSLWEMVFRWAMVISLVAGGITATALFVSGWVGYQLADTAQKDADARIADAKRDTAAALERIAELNTETTRLSADADSSRAAIAEANARALEAEATLAKFKAPRNLDDTQRENLTKALTTFSNIDFVLTVQDDAEAIAFAIELADVMTDAGWKWLPYTMGNPVYTIPGKPSMGLSALEGVEVYIDDSLTSKWGLPTQMLVNELQSFGITANGRRIIDGTEPVKTAIHVYVGQKPK
jgi:hypothetical protein